MDTPVHHGSPESKIHNPDSSLGVYVYAWSSLALEEGKWAGLVACVDQVVLAVYVVQWSMSVA